MALVIWKPVPCGSILMRLLMYVLFQLTVIISDRMDSDSPVVI